MSLFFSGAKQTENQGNICGFSFPKIHILYLDFVYCSPISIGDKKYRAKKI